MSAHPTIAVNRDNDPDFPKHQQDFRWLCSACGASGIHMQRDGAYRDGEQHLADKHRQEQQP